MSVKNLLAKQEAGFISLHDVLTQMTQIDGTSYQEAAIVLHRLLWAENETSCPQWYICDKLYGKRKSSEQQAQDAWKCLKQAAQAGTPPVWNDDEIPF